MSSQEKWFAVKTLYKLTAAGRPKNKDKYYHNDHVFVEERVVLFKADNDEEAFEKAVKEGAGYAESLQFENIYQQKITASLMKGIDMYEFFESPADGIEVFNDNQLFKKKQSDDQIIEARLNQETTEKEQQKRKKFIQKEVAELIYPTSENE